jgi:hypothetical protein
VKKELKNGTSDRTLKQNDSDNNFVAMQKHHGEKKDD